jgi:hypothetical protein
MTFYPMPAGSTFMSYFQWIIAVYPNFFALILLAIFVTFLIALLRRGREEYALMAAGVITLMAGALLVSAGLVSANVITLIVVIIVLAYIVW